MPMTLPAALIAAIQEGRAVLFLGAGASRGAKDPNGGDIPDARKLATLLQDKFLGAGYDNLDLRATYDLACNQRDVRTVQAFLFEIINPFQPAVFHRLIPRFAWAGICTTNYDLVIERAYKTTHSPLQKLVPNTRDGDGSTDQLDGRSVLYIKLHGCLTRHGEIKPPMVTSTEQLIGFREGREGQVATFLEWAKTKTLIFCGYSFLDANLRTLFDEIIKEGDNRPRHYIVNKDLRPLERDYWRDRRVEAFDATFQEFLEAIDAAIEPAKRPLALAAAAPAGTTSFHRFITLANASESDELAHYLNSFIEHIGPDIDPADQDAARFYSGFELGWFPVKADLDVRQSVVDEILKDYVIPAPGLRLPIVVIKGHAGSGKSIALRRICYEAATRHGKLCFFVSGQHLLQPERFEEIFRLTNLPVYLFIDSTAEHRDSIADVIHLARKMKAPLRIIGTETYSAWNILCEDLEPFVSDVVEMRYLSEDNITELLAKLEKHRCLGYLEKMPMEKRIHELRHVHGRQILVALLEATHGVPLSDLLAHEYQTIPSQEAKHLYLDICALHRFGPPVRAGLISRIHNIDFKDFQERMFKPLEAIVITRQDRRSGDYVYEARHSFIAHAVYDAALKTPDERFDNLMRIIVKLNPGYSYDLEVLRHLVRAESLKQAIVDPAKIRQVYDAAESALGERTVVLHQRGIFEMHAGTTPSHFDLAERYLSLAQAIEPHNPAIQHSLAELELKRSHFAGDRLERQAYRRLAVEKAAALAGKGSSPYPHHTLLKAATDAIKDALEQAEGNTSEAADLHLGEAIANAETVLKRGLQQFPNEAILLAGEGELSKVLSQVTRAEKAFEKSFKQNPRSTLTAMRLAAIKRAKGEFLEARDILQKSLEYNPSARDIHYDLARTILESAPDADETHASALLYHLQRSFVSGDQNYQAKFWYARQLTLMDRYDDARALFRELRDAAIPIREKTTTQGDCLNATGQRRNMTGTVSSRHETFGFIKCEVPRLDAFFVVSPRESDYTHLLRFGDTVEFNLTFTLRGPMAINIHV